MRKLTELNFDNTYARLPEAFYTKLHPTPLPAPYLVSFNPAAAELIDLDPREGGNPDFIKYFSGDRILPGAEPLAMLYAGHQFGTYVPQLGDGRAILLGEVRNRRGEKWDLHLKGAGRTPYSRFADGRAVLRSTIREYLCGEAMHGLGIPTTRALCVVGSDEPVYRETAETAAVLLRLSPSHVRFGTFEVFFYRGQYDRTKQLADYVIADHFPDLTEAADKYPRFLSEVVRRTARLIAEWQAVGFAHGVMNTDNMSVLGVTIDYGPFGFLDEYDPQFICNHSDTYGRYAFDRQPGIGLWNLTCLAQVLLGLMEKDEAIAALEQYEEALSERYGELMRAKLGLREKREEDAALLGELLRLMQESRANYTIFFRRLCDFRQREETGALREMFADGAAFSAWAARYAARLAAEQSDDAERGRRMKQTNPKYVLRNYLAEQAIRRAVGERDYAEVDRLLKLLARPFDEQPGMEEYAAPPPAWSKQVFVSCSS
jgi:serine/tyrosine/threonine adenylyltransferase